MAALMKDNSDLEKNRVEANLLGQMELFIKVNSKMDLCKDKEYINYQKGIFMKDSLEKTKDMVKED
jgi:hypothetical protein